MTLPSPHAIERDTRLLLSELAFLVGFLINEEAGCNLLADGQSGWSDYRQVRPEEIPTIGSFDAGERVARLQRYVFAQEFSEGLADDVELFPLVLGMIFSEAFRTEYLLRTANEMPAPSIGETASQPGFYTGALEQLLAHAQARYNVDFDQPLSFLQMGLLTGKTEAAVNTAAYRDAFAFSTNNAGKKEAQPSEVLAWLKANGYAPTQGFESTWDGDPNPPSPGKEDFVFVPVARDGTWFGPDCASGGRYTIGAKGSEVKYTNFNEALAVLQQMDPPRWRRPGPTAPGIVTGVRFERMRRDQLGA